MTYNKMPAIIIPLRHYYTSLKWVDVTVICCLKGENPIIVAYIDRPVNRPAPLMFNESSRNYFFFIFMR